MVYFFFSFFLVNRTFVSDFRTGGWSQVINMSVTASWYINCANFIPCLHQKYCCKNSRIKHIQFIKTFWAKLSNSVTHSLKIPCIEYVLKIFLNRKLFIKGFLVIVIIVIYWWENSVKSHTLLLVASWKISFQQNNTNL